MMLIAILSGDHAALGEATIAGRGCFILDAASAKTPEKVETCLPEKANLSDVF